MSMAREELAERVRQALPPFAAIAEKKMFGAIAFLESGNMLAGALKDGSLLVRVGKDGMAAALEQPGTSVMEMSGRSLAGFVIVSGDMLEDDDALTRWLTIARSVVLALPPK